MRGGGAGAGRDACADTGTGADTDTGADTGAGAARALTLIEIIVAIVVLLGITALVLPNVRRTLDERTFENATERVVTHLLVARAHAQHSQRPVAVSLRSSGDGLVARFFVPDDAPQTIGEPWATRSLPDGVRVGDRATVDTDEPPGLAAPRDARADPSAEGDDPAFVVFLPDGSTLRDRPLWLGDAGDRRAVITVDPWTGLPAAERRDADDDTDEDDSENESEPEEEAPDERVAGDERSEPPEAGPPRSSEEQR